MASVRWEVHGGGTIDLDDCDGMEDEEIESWIMDGVVLEVVDQGKYSVTLHGLAEAIRKLKEED